MRSIGIVAVLSAAFAVSCVTLAFAQDFGAPPPPPPSGGGSFGGSQPPSMPPPPSGGSYQPPSGGYQPSSGQYQPPMMPPPPQGGGYQQPSGGQQYQPPSGGQYQPQRPQMSPPPSNSYGQQGEQEGMMRGGAEQGMYNQKGSQQEMMKKGQEMMRGKGQEMMRGESQGGSERGMMQRGSEQMQFDGSDEENNDSDFEDQQAEREKQMQKQQLSEMKRNLRGMEQGLKMIKSMIDKLTKQNVSVPSEYTTLVTDLTQALAVVKSATEMTDEVESAMSVIMERGEELRDVGPRLGALAQWPNTLKQASAQVKRMEAQLLRVKKNKAATAYPALIAKVEAAVGIVKSAFEQAKSEASGGDIETAMETLRDGVFEGSQDAYDSIRVLENIANLSRVVKQAEKEIVRYEKEATRYEKQKKDVSALRGLIAEMKGKLAEVKTLMASGNAEPDDLFEVMSGAENLRNDAEAELQHLRGKPSSVEKQFQNGTADRAGAAIGKSLQGLKTK